MARKRKRRAATMVADYSEPRSQEEILVVEKGKLVIEVTVEERRMYLQWVRDYSNSQQLGRPGVRDAGYYWLRNKPYSFLRPDYEAENPDGTRKLVNWSDWAKQTLIAARKKWNRGDRGPDAFDPMLLDDSGNPDVVTWKRHRSVHDWHAQIDDLQLDPWVGQPVRVVVLCEKDGKSGIIANACYSTRTPYMCCGGDATLMQKANVGLWAAGHQGDGFETVFLYAGDHDMQGVNMDRTWVRDVAEVDVVTRVAITLEQARERGFQMESASDKTHEGDRLSNAQKGQNTKIDAYVRRYGDDMIELNELDEFDLRDLVRDAVTAQIDQDVWDERQEAMSAQADVVEELKSDLADALSERIE